MTETRENAPTGKITSKQWGRSGVGATFLVVGGLYLNEALKLDSGDLSEPGPGMWPTVVASAMILVSVITIIEALLRTEPGKDPHIESLFGPGPRRAAFLGVVSITYVLLMPVAGFYLASIAMMVACMRHLGGVSWLKSFLLTVALVTPMHFVFVTFFETPFPRGLSSFIPWGA